MFYSPDKETSGLPFNPFKSCCVPRPIGWISSISADGIHNLAPFSQFQNITWDPPTIMIAVNSQDDGKPRDTAANILATREFVWNMATFAQRELVVGSSRDLPPEVDEFVEIGIDYTDAVHVRPRRVKASPVQFECRLIQHMEVPGKSPSARADVIVGEVIGIHVDDDVITEDGRIDILRLQPLARMGYRDYTDVRHIYELSEFTGRDAQNIPHLHEPAPADASETTGKS